MHTRTHHERAVRVFKRGMGSQDRVVGLNDRVSHRRRGVDAELELRLLAIVGGKALEDESTEAGTSSTTKRVEHEEALQTVAIVGQPANLVHNDINLLLANGVVATSVYKSVRSKRLAKIGSH